VTPRRRERLDGLLVAQGMAGDRSRAEALIRAGRVLVNGQRQDKPGFGVTAGDRVEVTPSPPFVSRGGTKLAHALDAFGVSPRDLVCLDVGASTGGFTDALLQRGASRVHAVDVGRGQLAWRLRCDPRVVALERTDIRAMSRLEEAPTLAVVDVAFISLRRVLPAVGRLLAPRGRCIALVKPQFEAPRRLVGRGGIVRNPEVHRGVLERVIDWCTSNGWTVLAGTPAPGRGPGVNREFLLLLVARGASTHSGPASDRIIRAAMGDSAD